MTVVTTGWEVPEDLRAAQEEVPRAAAGRDGRVGMKHGGTAAWRPAVDISERRDAYVVAVEIPGVIVGEVGKAEASACDGVLEIAVPKAPEAQAGLIRVPIGQGPGPNASTTPRTGRPC